MTDKSFCGRHPRVHLVVGLLLVLACLPDEFAQAQTTPPTITSQPRSQSVSLGANVSFRVTAMGTPSPSYQWRWNDTAVDAATNSTLALPNLTLTQPVVNFPLHPHRHCLLTRSICVRVF